MRSTNSAAVGSSIRLDGSFLPTLRQTLATWWARYQTRQDLAALTESDLRNIGLTRFEAEKEANKPFWQE